MIKTVESKGEERISRRSWTDQFYTEIDQVQKRFNFFLLTSSILLFAFVIVVSGGLPGSSGRGAWIAFPLGILGALLSLYFFWINYFQSRAAEIVRSRRYTQPVPEDKLESGEWLREGWYAAWKHPFQVKHSSNWMSGYTWFIPFDFFLLWLVILAIRMNFYGFSLIAIPLGFQLWFSRGTFLPVLRTKTALLRKIMIKLGHRTTGLFKEFKANGSVGLSVEKQALGRMGRRMMQFAKVFANSCKKITLKVGEVIIKLFRRSSGNRSETVLTPEDPE